MIDTQGSIASLRAIWSKGPGMHKNPEDLVRYQQVINRVRPQVVVETGLYYGGSQLWFAQRVPHVINVELDTESIQDFRTNRHGLGFPPPNGHIVEGNSVEVFDEVERLTKELANGGPVMVVLDSDHGTPTVYGEACLYSQLVTPASYMIVEDGILHFLPQNPSGHFEGPGTPHNWFDGDPLIAIERFLSEHDDFTPDMDLEDSLPTTQHPKGWLLRGVPVRRDSSLRTPAREPVTAERALGRTLDIEHVHAIEDENARLRRIVVDQALEIERLKEPAGR